MVNKISPGYDELAGRTKDMGSAAVLLSLLGAAAAWVYALGTIVLAR